MYAVIGTGGKQYKVALNDVIFVEKLNVAVDDEVKFEVLLFNDDETLQVGNPILENVTVTGKVTGQVKGRKLTVFKMKAKKNYRKKIGHRQPYTRVEIVEFNTAN